MQRVDVKALIQLKGCKDRLPRQTYKTIRGQILAGDSEGAMKGLRRLLSKETNEVAIKNFLRHSIVKGGAPVRDCLIKELRNVKDRSLIDFVFSHIKGYDNLNETVKNIITEYEEKNGM